MLRRKLTDVLAAMGIAADSHDGKDVAEFLESYPREELFQTPAAELVPVAQGVLRLREHRQTRLFLRKDIYGRYMSCLVYFPRDRYTTQVRLRTQEILCQALHGAAVDYSVLVGESPYARLHIVVRAERGQVLPDVDAAELEAQVAAVVRSWDDDLAEEAESQLGEERARTLLAMCSGEQIPQTYKADVPASVAVDDLEKILRLRESGENVTFDLWESESYVGGVPIDHEDEPGDAASGRPRVWRMTIYRTGSPITLTDVLPRLQHMGVEVVDEHPYEFGAARAVLDLRLRAAPERRGPGRGLARPAVRRVGQGTVPGRADRALARGRRGRRVQRAGARRAPDLAAGGGAARLRQVPAPGGQHVQPELHRAGAALQHHHHPAPGAAVRVPVRPGPAAGRGRAQRGHHRGDQGRARRRGQPRPGPDPARLLGADPGHAADELLRRSRGPVPGGQARRRAGARPARAAAGVRAVRLLAPVRGRAPAVRRRGPGRAALVGPPGGLPHRDPRPGQGAGGEELGDRPLRRQGRVRLQAAARPRRPRGLPGRGARLLPQLHQRDAGRDRQHRGRAGGAARARGPPRPRRPLPRGRRRQGHGDVLRHRERDRAEPRVLARGRVRLRRVGGLRPQEDGHHRAGRLGVGQVPLPDHGDRRRPGRLHRGRDRRHVR